MEYMERRMQDIYDGFDAKVSQLDPFINDLLVACKKHGIDNDDLNFVTELFNKGYMPKLNGDV
ncbi:MAG: hypothetical protein AB1Y26_07665 [Cycloclasticus sp.]